MIRPTSSVRCETVLYRKAPSNLMTAAATTTIAAATTGFQGTAEPTITD
ncbi:unnamed protein product [Gongylonema pulchrum]|uniref:Uncharacterized protein n=1 Tax=Gongylonema pulchrum TaxID=637853 RepID=A0A183E5K8_9BILA|nr:unnamed protein product [Gongylonema pulchrum]